MNDENKELRTSGEHFPVDVVDHEHLPIAPLAKPQLKVHRLTTYEMNGYESESGASFGLDPKETARVLRETADRIESREYLIQSASVLTRAEREDYQMTYMTLEFHQKRVE